MRSYNKNVNIKVRVDVVTELAVSLPVSSKGGRPKETWAGKECSDPRSSVRWKE